MAFRNHPGKFWPVMKLKIPTILSRITMNSGIIVQQDQQMTLILLHRISSVRKNQNLKRQVVVLLVPLVGSYSQTDLILVSNQVNQILIHWMPDLLVALVRSYSQTDLVLIERQIVVSLVRKYYESDLVMVGQQINRILIHWMPDLLDSLISTCSHQTNLLFSN